MKKILSLLCLFMVAMTTAWAGEVATFNLGTKNGVSTPEGFFKSVGEKWNWNTKFTGGEYDGISFSTGLKMEGTTKIGFTTTAVSTVTIVQSTWSANTIKLDDVELAVTDAEEGTGCRIYTVKDVEAGDHVIARGSGESGLFYIKVEWQPEQTVTFINDAEWEKVYVWAWNEEENFTGGTWPGVELSGVEGIYQWKTTGDPEWIIFSDGTTQTSDMEFKNGGVYNSKGRIITLNDYTVTFTTDGMDEVWAYVWNGDEKALGDWPGTQMIPGNGDGDWKITVKAEEAPKYIIFHNNAGEQTPDWAFEDGKAYEYMLNEYTATFTTDAGWTDVYAYAWNNSDPVKEFAGAWPGTQLTATDGVYAFSCKAFNAPEKIQFNIGSDEGKTADLPFINGKAYKWITATPLYALTEGETFAAGTTVDVKDGDDVVATITYGVEGGDDFQAAVAGIHEDFAGFGFYTPGNGVNGAIDNGTVYTIVPKYDGNITIGVRLNGNKAMHINEDGTDMPGFNGYKIAEAANTSFSFDVKAGSTYKIWCDGSKLGFFGFDYTGYKELSSFSLIFNTNAGWEDVYAYVWSGDGQDEVLGKWPGKKMSYNERYSQFELSFEADKAPEKIIFNDGVGGNELRQTADLDFENQKVYQYSPEMPAAVTATFNFADPNFRENIGTAMSDVAGFIYNETFIAEETSLQITAGSAPSRIYVDANRGQNLVTYKEYTTLTFRAPADKVITKIEFTAAGNSNIKNFTASSGAIEGMTWTGKAYGVRFLQGGTSYLANAIVTLEAAAGTVAELPAIDYTECANIAAFNALEPGTYAKVHLKDAEIIGKSADGYSTVWIQDATGGAWIQYTSLNDFLQESNKVNGAINVIKRFTAGNPQMKEAEDTPNGSIMMGAISSYTTIDGESISAINKPENLNRVVKIVADSLVMTSNTAGILYLGETETIAVDNGADGANQRLHKIAEWAKGTKLENVEIVAILAAKSTSENALFPISIELKGETEAGEELNVERYPEMGYTLTEATVDFTAAKEFLGVENVSDATLWIVNPDNTEVGATSTDGWFNTRGYAETWGDLNNEAEAADKAGINVKFFQAIPEGTYTICDMNGADELGKTYTTKWALKANGKTYTYTINVTFVEAPEVGDLTKSDLAIATSVEYTIDEGSYVTKWASLTDEQVAAICTELGIESLSQATVYGYNPTTGELVSNFAGFDGWRGADGDFHNWTGNAEAPFCIKYSDGQNYECYNIGGLEPQTFKGYWAIANDTKYVLVEIDFIYAEPAPVVLDLTDVMEEITVTYNVTDGDYTEQTVTLSDEQKQAILTAIGLEAFTTGEGDEQVWYADAYVYDPEAKTFAADNSNGWRGIDGLGHNWTGNLDAPFCVQFRGDETFYFYNLQNIEPQTFVTYFAIANSETGKAALLKVNFTYEGTFPHYTVAGVFKAGEEETASFFGTTWDAASEANDMAHSTENRNVWTLTFEDVELTAGTIFYKVVADHSWDTNWGFDGNNADYAVNMPEGYEKAVFDITFTFSPVGLSNGYNVSCDVVFDKEATDGGQTDKCDVNGDGTVDVADIASIISAMAGTATGYDADTNGDGVVDVADIATVISRMAALARAQKLAE